MRSLAFPSPEGLDKVISETEEQTSEKGAGRGGAAERLARSLESGPRCPLLCITCIV